MELLSIFDKYECDKGSLKHRYNRVYESLLTHMRNEPITLLEIGIFKGSSLSAWIDYFPNAIIVGIDIFNKIPPEEIEILNHPRVLWCNCDSTKEITSEFKEILEKVDRKFNVIIDDGAHTHIAQTLTFENFIPFLKRDGIYFIEDVWPFDIMSQREKRHQWLRGKYDFFSDRLYQNLLNLIEPYYVKKHDYRTRRCPDSYIIEIRRKSQQK